MHCPLVFWLEARGQIQNVPAGSYAFIVRMSALRYSRRWNTAHTVPSRGTPIIEFRASCYHEDTELNFKQRPTARSDEPCSDVAFAATYAKGGDRLFPHESDEGAWCSILVGALQVSYK